MATYRVGVIGCGDTAAKKGAMGYAMAWAHAEGYEKLGDQCEMVACADLVPERAGAFAKRFGFTATYTDYRTMLAEEGLDIVSISVWPKLHAEMTIAAAEAGVKAIHCEKPIAYSWGDCKRMVAACDEHGVQLTFNHQRRFGQAFVKAKALMTAGEIGELVQMGFGGGNLYDTGTHFIDMMSFFNDETPATWVLAQLDYREPHLVFGADHAGQALAQWQYENGVLGLATNGPGTGAVGAINKLWGTAGAIEIEPTGDGMPPLRIKRDGQRQWEAVDTEGESIHGPGFIDQAMAEIVNALATGTESQLCARRAMIATEIIFACYESSRRRARVDLPLDIDDHPLQAMIDAGEIGG